MADETISPNMNLPIPGVGLTDGPTWADDLNASLTLIDAHNHTPGYGVAIPPSGLNINSDLGFQDNNATDFRSVRFQIQSALLAGAADLGCLYENGVDLYYNDGNGNQIRITQSGNVAGTPGSIGSLVSPASATYVGGTPAFVFQSDANVAASLDGRNLILRNSAASSKGLTIQPPAGMAADITMTLPSFPGSGSKIVTLASTGAMSAITTVDGTTLQLGGGLLSIKDSGVGTTQIADGNVTTVKLGVLGHRSSSSSGSFSTLSTTPTPVTNLTATITTWGRPVQVMIIPASGISDCYMGITAPIAGTYYGIVVVKSDGVEFARTIYGGITTAGLKLYPLGLTFFDFPSAGSHTYTVELAMSTAATGASMFNAKLVAFPL